MGQDLGSNGGEWSMNEPGMGGGGSKKGPRKGVGSVGMWTSMVREVSGRTRGTSDGESNIIRGRNGVGHLEKWECSATPVGVHGCGKLCCAWHFLGARIYKCSPLVRPLGRPPTPMLAFTLTL
eukprot:116022-Chlamydomonas_euryale.AAC.2